MNAAKWTWVALGLGFFWLVSCSPAGTSGGAEDAAAAQAWGITPRRAVFPLAVSSNGHYLEDQEGVPFFVHGDTPWSLTHNLTFEEAVAYLDDRRTRGFNSLIVSAPDAYGPDGQHDYPPDRYGHQPFLDDDLTRPDESYWEHVDRVVEKTEEEGFLVFFFPIYLGCCDDGYLGLLQKNGVDRAGQYGRWIGARYRERKNLIWVHGGDRIPDEARREVKAVRDGIADAAPEMLHTVHWAPEIDPWAPFGEDWVDLYTAYTYGPVAERVGRVRSHLPAKPVILIETHYEDDFGRKTADDIRKFPYQAVLAGAAGDFFGNRPLWFCGTDWKKALNSPGSYYLSLAGDFFRSRPWQKLEPDIEGRLVQSSSEARAADRRIQSAISETGDFALVYLPSGEPVTVDVSAISAARIQLWWFDPRNGLALNAGNRDSSSLIELTPPSRDDWALVIDDASEQYGPPGRLASSGTGRVSEDRLPPVRPSP